MHPILIHDWSSQQKLKAGDLFIGYSFEWKYTRATSKFYLDFVSDSASGDSSLM